MRAIAALLIVALVGCLAVAVPAGAQNVKLTLKSEHPPGHAYVLKRPEGTGTVELYSKIGIGNFTCVQATEALADLHTTFPTPQAGPIQPTTIRASIPAGETGPTNPYKEYPFTDARIELAWYVDQLPAKDVKHTYKVTFTNYRLANPAACPGAPDPAQWAKEEVQVLVVLEDAVANETNPCADLGENCATPTTEAPAESPALDVFGLLGICVAAAMILRRRK